MKLYNTLTKQKEDFQQEKTDPVKMYICGPTVYNYAHIGNLRTYVNEDLLRRTLEFLGYKIDEVMNITDIDDKIIKSANDEQTDISVVSKKYTKLFLDDLAAINFELPEHMPKATEEIDSMITLISDLLEKGFAYKSDDGSIYFSIAKFAAYGKLANLDFTGLKEGARVDQDEYDKENAQDFVLWKAKKAVEPSWEAPFGEGRPGWHIECSAMSMRYLGDTIDIHAGAVDLIFPHHENEIAQSEASTGKPFAKLWFHPEHIMINGAKMSKSLKNFYTLGDIVTKFQIDPLDFRMLCLMSHYREKMNFTDQSIIQARNTREKLLMTVAELRGVKESQMTSNGFAQATKKAGEDFLAALNDDLNTPKALAVIFVFIKELNKAFVHGVSEKDANAALKLLLECDRVLGLGLSDSGTIETPNEVNVLLEKRGLARNNKDFEASDRLRTEILDLGYEVEDTANGQKIRKI